MNALNEIQTLLQEKADYYLLCHIVKLVNEGFFTDGGRIRGVPVTNGDSSYKPPIPIESIVKEKITEIIESGTNEIDTAIKLKRNLRLIMKAKILEL